MSGSTSRVGIPLGAYGTLGGSLHARWIPPCSVDPSTLGGDCKIPYISVPCMYCSIVPVYNDRDRPHGAANIL